MYTYTIGIDFLGSNEVKCGKNAICFKPFGFLFIFTSAHAPYLTQLGRQSVRGFTFVSVYMTCIPGY